MEQQVAKSRGGCNSRGALTRSGDEISMVYLHIEDGSPVLRYRMLIGALQLMGFLVMCAGKYGFLRPNVSISSQQYCYVGV
jgi:hypothetical protein